MFTLASRYAFPADTELCWLSAGIGFDDEEDQALNWNLHLQSESILTELPQFPCDTQVTDPEDLGPKLTSFGIDVRLRLGVADWKDISGQIVEIPADPAECAFMIRWDMHSEWEPLKSLDLRFGRALEKRLVVHGEGVGSVDSVPNLFPAGEVELNIEASVEFRGVGVYVPLNARDPLEYAQTRVRALLPRYAFAVPQLRKTALDGRVRAVDVLYPPA